MRGSNAQTVPLVSRAHFGWSGQSSRNWCMKLLIKERADEGDARAGRRKDCYNKIWATSFGTGPQGPQKALAFTLEPCPHVSEVLATSLWCDQVQLRSWISGQSKGFIGAVPRWVVVVWNADCLILGRCLPPGSCFKKKKKKKNGRGCSVVEEVRGIKHKTATRPGSSACQDEMRGLMVKAREKDRVERCAWWRSRGSARWYHDAESDIAGWWSRSGSRDAGHEITSPSVWRGLALWSGVPLLLPHALAQCWLKVDRNRFAQKRRTKHTRPVHLSQTWVLVDGQLSRKLRGCRTAANPRLCLRAVAWRTAPALIDAVWQPHPCVLDLLQQVSPRTEACRSICQDAARAHP